jgi:cellulose synthase/poly-beta-1,6-N-acetylglucosamine synthase-like glycosyltransferase
MSLPTVSIVIPCRNEENYIKRCIDSIFSQEYGGAIECLVVDGMSTDKTRDIIDGLNYPNLILVDNPMKFTPNAMNLGIKRAKGEIFVILGAHAYLEKDFVSKNVSNLMKEDELACSGGIIKNIHENKTSELVSLAMSSSFGVGNARFRTGGGRAIVDTVAFGAYKKSVHEEIGGFDEELVRNQDDEYNYRVNKAGYKILFDPDICSYYYVRASLKKLFKQYYQYGYWKVFVNKKHQTVTTMRQLVPFIFVFGLVLGSILSFVHPFFLYTFLIFLIAYIFLALYSGLKRAKKLFDGIRVAPIFPILHISYGLGYLLGLVNFILLGNGPSKKSTTLSRD